MVTSFGEDVFEERLSSLESKQRALVWPGWIGGNQSADDGEEDDYKEENGDEDDYDT
jgi:hypothetical protein